MPGEARVIPYPKEPKLQITDYAPNCSLRFINMISDFKTPEEVLKHYCLYGVPSTPLVVFNQVNPEPDGVQRSNWRQGDYGDKLKDYIESNNLGTVGVSGDVFNPMHKERTAGVRGFIWAVDTQALRVWAEKHNVTKPPVTYF